MGHDSAEISEESRLSLPSVSVWHGVWSRARQRAARTLDRESTRVPPPRLRHLDSGLLVL